MGASKRAEKIDAVKLAPKLEEGAASGKHRAALHKQLVKTKICMYHLKGMCQYGSDCTFAHSSAELQSTPDLWKTRLCKAYAEGGCNDPECGFAHGESELRSTDTFFKKTLCIWNEKGKCRDGDRCRFAHGITELRLQAQAQVTQTADYKDSQRHAPNLARARINAMGVRRPMATSTNDTSLEPMKITPLSSLGPAPYEEHQPSTPPGLMSAPPGLLQLPKGLDQITPQESLVQDFVNYSDPTNLHGLSCLLKAQLESTAALFSQYCDQLDQSKTDDIQAATMMPQYCDPFAKSHALDEMLLTFGKDKPYTLFDEAFPMPQSLWKRPDENEAFGMLASSRNDLTNLSDHIIL